MSRVEELIMRSKSGDTEAKHLLVTENSGLIWSVAKRFVGRGTDADDLYQLGCVGFLKAVEGFEPTYGTQFSTYAVPKISGEIRRFLRDDGAVKVSRSVKERAVAIKVVSAQLTTRLGREPSLTELEIATGFTAEQIAVAESATANVESIQQEHERSGFKLEYMLADPNGEENMLEKIALNQAVQGLPEKEKMVIHLRYYHAMTQSRVAAVLGVSQVQVSRIEKKAIQHLKEQLQ